MLPLVPLNEYMADSEWFCFRLQAVPTRFDANLGTEFNSEHARSGTCLASTLPAPTRPTYQMTWATVTISAVRHAFAPAWKVGRVFVAPGLASIVRTQPRHAVSGPTEHTYPDRMLRTLPGG